MKKHLLTIGLLIVAGGFVYFQNTPTPSYAAKAASGQEYTNYNEYFRQDTTPRTDTSRYKMKKHKMKKDSTWRKDSIPQ